MLTETVEVGVVGELGPKAHVLFLEDQGDGFSIKKNFTTIPALDCKRKRILLYVKLEGCAVR